MTIGKYVMFMVKPAKIWGNSDLSNNVNNILQVVTSTVKAKPKSVSHDIFQDENSRFNDGFLTLY